MNDTVNPNEEKIEDSVPAAETGTPDETGSDETVSGDSVEGAAA